MNLSFCTIFHFFQIIFFFSHCSDIETGTEDIHLLLMESDIAQKETLIGQVSIPLNSLNHQNQVEESHDLYDENGNPGLGKVSIQAQ